MVIDESALIRAMKDAHKKDGYKVAADEGSDGNARLMIAAAGWMVEINQENCPRKVLALIVLHLGKLPRIGQAFQVQKKQTQTEIFDVAVGWLYELKEAVVSCRAKRTDLSWHGYQLWQRGDNLQVFMVPPLSEDIMDNFKRPVEIMEGSVMRVSGEVSCLYILPSAARKSESAALTHLSKMQWI